MVLADIGKQVAAELKASRKKAVLVCVLVVVAMFMAVRMLASQGGRAGGSPAGASASTPASNCPPSNTDAEPGPPALSAADREAQKRDRYIQKLDGTIVRDIFEPNSDFFPALAPQSGLPGAEGADSSPGADSRQVHEKLICGQAALLKLQSIVVGNMPTAIVNNRVLRVGDFIEGFEIVRITPHSCVVCKENVEVPLSMDK